MQAAEEIMKLAVFGGTGKTGRLLVEQALAAGHEVAVLARTPGKMALNDARLRVIEGDALDPNRVEEVVSGVDAIISLLGPAKDAPPLSVSRSTENILQAATRCGVRRLVIAAGAGVGDPADKPGLFDKVISTALKTAAKGAYEDMSTTAGAVRASDLDWTLVRIPMLTDDPAKGSPRVGYLGKGAGMRLSRADLAAFMLQEAAARAYLRQAPVVSN
jgi:putative NADH-flavin reductase